MSLLFYLFVGLVNRETVDYYVMVLGNLLRESVENIPVELQEYVYIFLKSMKGCLMQF